MVECATSNVKHHGWRGIVDRSRKNCFRLLFYFWFFGEDRWSSQLLNVSLTFLRSLIRCFDLIFNLRLKTRSWESLVIRSPLSLVKFFNLLIDNLTILPFLFTLKSSDLSLRTILVISISFYLLSMSFQDVGIFIW